MLIALAQIPQRADGLALGKVGTYVSILVKNVGYSVGRSRRLAPVGLTRFKGNIASEVTRRWFRSRPHTNSELRAGAPSRGASRAIALCTHPPLRRERYRSNPA